MELSNVQTCEHYISIYICLRDSCSFHAFEDLRKRADIDKHPLPATLVALAHCLGCGISKDIALAKELAKNCVFWLRDICESPDRQSDPLFPIVAYPYSLCIYYELDEEQDLNKYLMLLQDAMSVKPYPFLCCNVGHAYYSGLNGTIATAANAAEAFRLFNLAADGGLAAACHFIGKCYYRAFGVEKDEVAALQAFKQAVVMGYKKALIDVGECFYFSIGVEYSDTEAAKWFQEAAECGFDRGQYMLAYCFYHGLGREQDLDLAMYWSQIAYAQGNLSAGLLYAATIITDKRLRGEHLPLAVATLLQLAKKGKEEEDLDVFQKAAYYLGFYYLGYGNEEEVNKVEALKWFWHAFQSEDYRLDWSQTDHDLIPVVFITACECNDQRLMRFIIEHEYFDTRDILTTRKDLSVVTIKHAVSIMVELGLSLSSINCQPLPVDVIVDYEFLSNEVCTNSQNQLKLPFLDSYTAAELLNDFRLRLEHGLEDLEMFARHIASEEQEQWGDMEWAIHNMLF